MAVDWMKRLGDNHCDRCNKSVRTGLRKTIFGNGALAIVQVCLNSDPPHFLKNQSNYIPHETAKALGYKIEDIELLAPESKNLYIDCQVFDCKNPGAEDHHTSPTCVFGDEADNWPRILLCVKHHTEWHQRMMGYPDAMKRKGDLKHVSEVAEESGIAAKVSQ